MSRVERPGNVPAARPPLSDKAMGTLYPKNMKALNKRYNRHLKIAKQKGWTVPVNKVFSKEVWLRYWGDCMAYEDNSSHGRPVAPHRSA